MYPEHDIIGGCSEADRAYMACVATLLGAGVVPLDGNIEVTSALNVVNVPDDFVVEWRNIKDKYQRLKLLFDKHPDALRDAGTRAAKYLVSKMVDYVETDGEKQTIGIYKSHQPVISAANLLLAEYEINCENIIQVAGLPAVGEGFSNYLRKDGGIYIVNITLSDNRTAARSLDGLIAQFLEK